MEAAKRRLSQRIVLTCPNLTAYKDEHSPWNFSLKCLFSYMLPFSKNQSRKEKKNKKTMREAKQMCFESGSQTWHEIRWIQERMEPSPPPREIPSDARPSSPSRWKSGVLHVGANRAHHHSFISDGSRFYNSRITCWFFPQPRLIPEERQDTGRVVSSHLQVPSSYLGINPME